MFYYGSLRRTFYIASVDWRWGEINLHWLIHFYSFSLHHIIDDDILLSFTSTWNTSILLFFHHYSVYEIYILYATIRMSRTSCPEALLSSFQQRRVLFTEKFKRKQWATFAAEEFSGFRYDYKDLVRKTFADKRIWRNIETLLTWWDMILSLA